MLRLSTIVISLLTCLLLDAFRLQAQSCCQGDSLVRQKRTTLTWGMGRANVLDTYLSPLEYVGSDFSMNYRTERKAHWGKGRVTVMSLYTGHYAYVSSPTDDGKEMDAEVNASGGWHYNWHPTSRLRLAAGGLMELTSGFTYNTRNSNNPAQARLGFSLWASAIASYDFRFLRKTATARLQLDAQMIGAQFSPEYGQSYYEIFSLGHHSGIVHFTQPANCPTVRLTADVTLPIKRSNITLGYLADIRQSRLGELKRHAWRNCFMIGFTRKLVRL